MVASEQVLVTGKQLDTLSINTIRTLAIDAVQQANSGHPGAPMGLAPVTYSLWQNFLRYDPADPTPGLGGPSLAAGNKGPKDQRPRDARADVLTYSGTPFERDVAFGLSFSLNRSSSLTAATSL